MHIGLSTGKQIRDTWMGRQQPQGPIHLLPSWGWAKVFRDLVVNLGQNVEQRYCGLLIIQWEGLQQKVNGDYLYTLNGATKPSEG